MRTPVGNLVVILALASVIAVCPTPVHPQASADTARSRRDRPLPGALRRQLQREERERQRRNDRRRRVEAGPADVPDRMIERRESLPRYSESDLAPGVATRWGQGRGLGLFGGSPNLFGSGLDFSSWLPFAGAIGSMGYGALSLFGPSSYRTLSPFGYDLPYPGYGAGSPLFGRGSIRSPYASTGRLSWPGRLTDLYRSPLDFYVYDEDYHWPYSELFEDLYRPLLRDGRVPGLGGCVFFPGRGTVCPPGGASSSFLPSFKEYPRGRN